MMTRLLLATLLLGLTLATTPATAPAIAADPAQPHRLVLQVSDNDTDKFNLALSNAANVSREYSGRGEEVEIEIVAYGPGLHMLRADTSPVKERIQSFVEGMPNVTLTACGNTMKTMEAKEGHPVRLLPGIGVVLTGVARLMELQEQGWSYVRP